MFRCWYSRVPLHFPYFRENAKELIVSNSRNMWASAMQGNLSKVQNLGILGILLGFNLVPRLYHSGLVR